MSASNEKDRMVAVGIYKAPANLSKEEFETKITSFVDRMLAVPIAQKNFLKFEIIYQNELLNQHIKAFDLPEAPTSVWLTVEFETEAHCAEILTDPMFAKAFAEAEEFVSCATGFVADVVTRIDRPTPKDRTHLMCAFQRPDHLSSDEYRKKFEVFVDRLLALPISQKNFLKHSLNQDRLIEVTPPLLSQLCSDDDPQWLTHSDVRAFAVDARHQPVVKQLRKAVMLYLGTATYIIHFSLRNYYDESRFSRDFWCKTTRPAMVGLPTAELQVLPLVANNGGIPSSSGPLPLPPSRSGVDDGEPLNGPPWPSLYERGITRSVTLPEGALGATAPAAGVPVIASHSPAADSLGLDRSPTHPVSTPRISTVAHFGMTEYTDPKVETALHMAKCTTKDLRVLADALRVNETRVQRLEVDVNKVIIEHRLSNRFPSDDLRSSCPRSPSVTQNRSRSPTRGRSRSTTRRRSHSPQPDNRSCSPAHTFHDPIDELYGRVEELEAVGRASREDLTARIAAIEQNNSEKGSGAISVKELSIAAIL
ncbi:hypothetical protein B0H13DRAFT_1876845 [Mycena leptocephala]|nr:hypothetical protein B0H13DRAFT_1876845 [Mycena leptocephala]